MTRLTRWATSVTAEMLTCVFRGVPNTEKARAVLERRARELVGRTLAECDGVHSFSGADVAAYLDETPPGPCGHPADCVVCDGDFDGERDKPDV